MKRSRFRFAFLSNSRPVAQEMQAQALSEGIGLEIHIVAMEEALSAGRDLLNDGVDVLLGCGTTGKMLVQTLDKRAVCVESTHLDVLRALQRAKRYSSTIALPFYGQVMEGLGLCAELLNMRIIPVNFHDTQSLISCISDCVNDGIQCVVGSNITVQIAEAQGCHGEEILYDAVEIRRSLREAALLAEGNLQKRVYIALWEQVLDTMGDVGVVAIGESSDIVAWNSCATGLLRTRPGQEREGDVIRALGLPTVFKRGEGAEYDVRDFGALLHVRTSPVLVEGNIRGALAFLHAVPDKARQLQAQKGFRAHYTLEDLVGPSGIMQALRQRAGRFARTEAALLITGETGTGKELLAHAMHDASPRRMAPFVAINCAALPESLLESELFGYEEGAFTGAKRGGKDGIFVMAEGGTVFLDEIADISPAVQVRLLRVLEAKEIMRVGGSRIIPVNIRVISSTCKDLGQEVRSGRFRADLYYRLSVLQLRLPPLRERLMDIGAIVDRILRRRGLKHKKLPPGAAALLHRHSWPGNIRELDALLQRYTLLLDGNGPDEKLFRELFEEMCTLTAGMGGSEGGGPGVTPLPGHGGVGLKEQMERYERACIQQTLAANHYNREATARALGISVNTLWRKLR